MSGCTCRLFIPVCMGSGSGMQNPLANFHWHFLLVRDDWGFQVNPLCRHDITSPFPPSGNEGYVRSWDVHFSHSFFLGQSWALCIWKSSMLHGNMQRLCQKEWLWWQQEGWRDKALLKVKEKQLKLWPLSWVFFVCFFYLLAAFFFYIATAILFSILWLLVMFLMLWFGFDTLTPLVTHWSMVSSILSFRRLLRLS